MSSTTWTCWCWVASRPPLDGFVAPDESPAPVTLTVPATTAEVASAVGHLDLIDPEGAPLARLTVTRTWATEDDGRVGLVGPVEPQAHNEFGPFRRLHVPPATVHETRPADAWLAVPVHRPLLDSDLDAISRAAKDQGRTPLLLACVGDGMPTGVSGPALVRATLAAAELLGDGAAVVAVSIADHGWDAEPGTRLRERLAARQRQRGVRRFGPAHLA